MKKMTKVAVAIVLGTSLLVLGGCGSSSSSAPAAGQASELKVYSGVGHTQILRIREDKEKKTKVYNVNVVTANAVFDKDGKILDVNFDILELGQPPAPGKEAKTVFSGWPNGTTITDEAVTKEVNAWQTKREMGDAKYGMPWGQHTDGYQDFFKGKTVAEVEQWFAKNASDVTGKPLTEKATDPKDKEKFGKLTDAEKKALADVTSGSTISLKDGHGDFIGALKEAFANKKEVSVK